MPKSTDTDLRPREQAETTRAETPELEGRVPLPEEITGKASSTDGDLVALLADDDRGHMADGFRGGSEDEPGEGEPAGE